MKHVLCYGDSNTWGFVPGTGARYDEQTRWTGILARMLGEDWCIHEDGLNARTSVFDVPAKPYLNGLPTFPAALVAQKPLDALVISLGTNDLKYATAMRSAEGVREYVHLAHAMDIRYPAGTPVFPNGVKILVVSPITVADTIAEVRPDSDLAHAAAQSKLFPEKFRTAFTGLNVELLDAQQYASPSPVDCIHMEPESHLALAKAIAEKLRIMLGA